MWFKLRANWSGIWTTDHRVTILDGSKWLMMDFRIQEQLNLDNSYMQYLSRAVPLYLDCKRCAECIKISTYSISINVRILSIILTLRWDYKRTMTYTNSPRLRGIAHRAGLSYHFSTLHWSISTSHMPYTPSGHNIFRGVTKIQWAGHG